MTTILEPFSYQSIVGEFTGLRAVRAEVVVATVERNKCLAARPMLAVLWDVVSSPCHSADLPC